MRYNWITGNNDGDDSKVHEAIAEKFGTSAKTIKRWLNLQSVSKIEDRFAQLARFQSEQTGIEVTVDDLAARFKKARALKCNEESTVATPLQAMLRQCLQDCAAVSVDLPGYCDDSIDAICERLSDRGPDNCQSALDSLHRAIDLAVAQVGSRDALDVLRRLIYTVALMLATPVIGDDDSDLEDIEDPGPICLLRLHIDAHLLGSAANVQEFRAGDYIVPVHEQGLSDSAPRSVRPPPVYKNTNMDYRLWRTARSIDSDVFAKSQVPRPNTEANRQQLTSFLKRLDIRIRRANKSGKHFFLLAPHTESREYLSMLNTQLRSLRVFRAAPRDGIPLFTLDAIETEVWLAECLSACEKRELQLQTVAESSAAPDTSGSDGKSIQNTYNIKGDFNGTVGDHGTTKLNKGERE